jgi:hypothetical protein
MSNSALRRQQQSALAPAPRTSAGNRKLPSRPASESVDQIPQLEENLGVGLFALGGVAGVLYLGPIASRELRGS